MSKKRIILGLVLVIILGAGGYLYFNINAMIVRTAEKIATNALGVGVHIGGIDLSLREKSVTVSNIAIENPKGYKNTNIVTVDSVAIGLTTASKTLIDFKNIDVTGSTVNLEVNEKGMNIVDLKNLANKNTGTKEETTSEQAIKVIIRKMVIAASTINTRVSFLDRDIASITMPSIRFSNLGQDNGGIDAGDAISKVIVKYMNAIKTEVQSQGVLTGVAIPGMDDVQKTLDSTLDSAKDTLKSLF